MERSPRQSPLSGILLVALFVLADAVLGKHRRHAAGVRNYYAENEGRIVTGSFIAVVVIEMTPAGPFWEAEVEPQDYLAVSNGYTCHFRRPNWVVLPRRAAAAAG